MIFNVNLFFSLFSLLLLYLAPKEYSYNYCLFINILYIIQNIAYFKIRNEKSLVGFQFIFMIAFYFTNFVYPVFYFPTNPTYSVFELQFNYNIISKATAIAFVAYSFYLLGLSRIERKSVIFEEFKSEINYDAITRFAFIMSFISLVLFILFGGNDAMESLYSGEGNIIDPGVSIYFYMLLFSVATILSSFLFNIEVRIKRALYFLFLSGILFFFLLIGTRTLPIALCLILLVSYSRNRKIIPNSVFLSILVFGAILLTFIMFARSSSISDQNYTQNAINNTELNSFWDIGSDLIINNRNLYTLIDLAENNGHTFGINMLGGLFSPIPFLQSFFCNVFSVPVYLIGSASLNSFLEFGADFTWGLGTNVVSDVYLAFGLIGVLIFFTFLGWIIGKAEHNSSKNVYWNVVYLLFVSNSVYLVRSGFFDSFRTFVWSLLIVFLYSLSLSKRIKML